MEPHGLQHVQLCNLQAAYIRAYLKFNFRKII